MLEKIIAMTQHIFIAGSLSLLLVTSAMAQPKNNTTRLHPDAERKDGVPRGIVEEMAAWESKIFPSTARDWAIYVPSQYRASTPAALMVFQDGHSYKDVEGRWRVPIVFDNLIASGEMPIIIAVFINPGHDQSKGKQQTRWKASNRSYEYDSLGDRYANFLLNEIIPEVEKRYSISKDPEMRAICGASSGGICAFTVAWERPDQFRKVLSTIGSFTNLRGGNIYPSLIRKTEPKPLRVYLADSSGDLDNPFGNWPIANRQMASALKYMGYDVRFDWAEGFGHSPDHAAPIFPDALRWLWRNENPQSKWDTSDDLRGDLTLLKLLVPGQGWELVADGLGFADGLCSDSNGNFYFCDMRAPKVFRVDASTNRMSVVAEESVSGMEFGPDGLIYACQGTQNRVVAIDPKSGKVTQIVDEVAPNDLAVAKDGAIYITETKYSRITRIDSKSKTKSIVDEGIERPNGITLSPDGGTLAVSDAAGSHVWTFRVRADGRLDAKMPTMTLSRPIDPKGDFKFHESPPYLKASRGDGMCVDSSGRYFVTSAVGVQVFDPTGRLCGVLPKINVDAGLTSCIMSGPEQNYLYIAHGDKIYRRKCAGL